MAKNPHSAGKGSDRDYTKEIVTGQTPDRFQDEDDD